MRTLATLAVAAGMLFSATAAGAAVPVIVNNAGLNSGDAQWIESPAGTQGSGNRQVTVSFVVRHDPGRRITAIARDTNFDGTDNTASLTPVPVTAQFLGSATTNRLASSVLRYTFDPGDPGGFSCPFAGGATRRRDVPLRFRVVDSSGERSASVSQNWHVVEEDDCLGRTDWPVLQSVSQSATTATPGQNVSFTFVCDDDDSAGTDDKCDYIRWRWRRLNDGTTSGLTDQDAEDNTSRTFGASFPSRGIYVVEAQLCGEDNCQTGNFWRIGSVMVNDSAPPSGSIDFTGPGVVGGATPSVNAGDAATAVASVDAGGPAQVIEWDANGDSAFERTVFTTPQLSGGDVTHASVSGAQVQQGIDTATRGLRTVNARMYDNGAIDAADTQRRTSSTITGKLRVNGRPVAEDVSATTDEDTAKQLTLPAEDADSQPAPLSYEVVDGPQHGTVELQGAEATYTPDPDYHGADEFTFRASDGPVEDAAWATSNTATVSLMVNPVNDPPTARNQSPRTEEDTPVVVTLTGEDVDGDPLTFDLTGDGPAHGSVECNGSDGSACTYTPDADYHGPDSFDFSVSDGNDGSDTGRVEITVEPVNDAPIAQDAPLVTDEDTAVAAVLGTDVDGDALGVTVTDEPDHGAVTCEAAECTYTPAADFHGADAFRFAVDDRQGGSDDGTASIEVKPVNDAPVAEDVHAATEEDTPVDVALVAADVDDAVLEYAVVDEPDHGDVSCEGALCTYEPAPDFHGTDTFTYRASDAHGASDEATVTIAVGEVLFPTAVQAGPLVQVSDLPSGISVRYKARLIRSDSGDPLAGKTITFVSGGQAACTAETGADGRASCEWSIGQALGVLLGDGYDAVFAGDPDHAPASAHGAIVG